MSKVWKPKCSKLRGMRCCKRCVLCFFRWKVRIKVTEKMSPHVLCREKPKRGQGRKEAKWKGFWVRLSSGFFYRKQQKRAPGYILGKRILRESPRLLSRWVLLWPHASVHELWARRVHGAKKRDCMRKRAADRREVWRSLPKERVLSPLLMAETVFSVWKCCRRLAEGWKVLPEKRNDAPESVICS